MQINVNGIKDEEEYSINNLSQISCLKQEAIHKLIGENKLVARKKDDNTTINGKQFKDWARSTDNQFS
ncbi:hypothetical protein PP175_18045 [Aneurinibacillus sp. Ricciae_BoGa-3]|uniref:hypothetical protein n=1 Tax=Aneurinibacillus sp. Ricciae_BoGa-3 TaxID=3022697 RepID=UPI002340D196|nr:hypothetical protein [Aneurinibacillus sp. Ricciae_BoGa-3]WCK53286.1 hypothetical protein PP175_18045 [Aneurinibacillus sp. Ricciae_BoGa-3]